MRALRILTLCGSLAFLICGVNLVDGGKLGEGWVCLALCASWLIAAIWMGRRL